MIRYAVPYRTQLKQIHRVDAKPKYTYEVPTQPEAAPKIYPLARITDYVSIDEINELNKRYVNPH